MKGFSGKWKCMCIRAEQKQVTTNVGSPGALDHRVPESGGCPEQGRSRLQRPGSLSARERVVQVCILASSFYRLLGKSKTEEGSPPILNIIR